MVVKQGSGGATVVTDDGEVTHPGFAVDPVDTTGAGDAFAAGFLAARTPGGRVAIGWRDVEALLDTGPSEA